MLSGPAEIPPKHFCKKSGNKLVCDFLVGDVRFGSKADIRTSCEGKFPVFIRPLAVYLRLLRQMAGKKFRHWDFQVHP